jgi:hypothetical protein
VEGSYEREERKSDGRRNTRTMEGATKKEDMAQREKCRYKECKRDRYEIK